MFQLPVLVAFCKEIHCDEQLEDWTHAPTCDIRTPQLQDRKVKQLNKFFPNLPFLRIWKSQNENKTSLKFGRFRVSAQTEKNNSKATFMERDSFDDFHLQLIKRSQVGPAVTGRPRHP